MAIVVPGLKGFNRLRQSRLPLRLASRRSRLARIQAQTVGQMLSSCYPDLDVQYVWFESDGDQQTHRPLDRDGKGLFTGTLEQALVERQADVAVHSLKDVSIASAKGLTIAAVPQREVVHDCFIARGPASFEELPAGSIVGTASPRRAAQLRRLRTDLRIEPIRGNVETRLRKVLDIEEYDATILAAAGLSRLGLHEHLTNAVPTELILPAPGQGALAIQSRSDDHVTLMRCMPLNQAAVAEAVHAERRIVEALGGDCHRPIAVLAEPLEWNGQPGTRIRARVLNPSGAICVTSDQHGPATQISRLVDKVLAQLVEGGAATLLAHS